MGWWPPWPFNSDEDVLKDLDPDLRKYLESQKLPAYSTTSAQTQGHRRSRNSDNSTYRGQLDIRPPKGVPKDLSARQSASNNDDNPESNPERPLPKEALFQDGRYAHLYKTYRSEQEINEAMKSDQERLLDILEAYKARRMEMRDAGLENCAQDQIDLTECYRHGSWSKRMNMCRAESRRLERCVTMQHQLLRALGFMSMFERTQEEQDKIQVHAWTLYQRMLRQEALEREAQKDGLPPPEPMGPLFRVSKPGEAEDDETVEPGEVRPVNDALHFDALPRLTQEDFLKKKWKNYTPMQVELAKQDFNQQMLLWRTLGGRVAVHDIADYKKRMKRRKEGKTTFGDRVRDVLDMRSWPELPDEDEDDQQAKS